MVNLLPLPFLCTMTILNVSNPQMKGLKSTLRSFKAKILLINGGGWSGSFTRFEITANVISYTK